MIRVAHAAFSVGKDSGGIGPVVRGLTGALGRRGQVEPVTWIPFRGEATVNGDWPGRLESFRCLGPPQHCWSAGLDRRYAAGSTDLVHTHGLWTFLARTDLAWRRRTGRPYLITLHGMTMPAALRFARAKKAVFWRLYERRHLERAGCLHALSRVEAESLRELGIRTPVCVIPNGVTVSGGERPGPEERGPERRLLYLGRLHPIKGLDELLGAWAAVRQSGGLADGWKLLVAGWGEGDYPSRLRARAGELGLERSVEFPGPVFGAAKEALLESVDGFVLPSRSEAFPMALLEAWAAGLPCLATEACRVQEPGEEEGTCLYVPASEEGLVEGLRQLLGMDGAARLRMGEAARGMARRRYAWDVVAEQMEQVYRWLVGGGPSPGTVRKTG